MPAPTVVLEASSTRMKLPGGPVAAVLVVEERLGGAQRDAPDLVEGERHGVLVAVQGVDVEVVLEVLDQRPGPAGRVLDRELGSGPQPRGLGHPAHHGLDVLPHVGLVAAAGDHVAAADVDVVGQCDGDRHRGEGRLDGPVRRVDGGDRRREPRRQHHDLVAPLEHAAGHLTRVAPVVVEVLVRLLLRADDVLHREAGVDEVAVRRDVDLLEVVQQRAALVPRHVAPSAPPRCRRAARRSARRRGRGRRASSRSCGTPP